MRRTIQDKIGNILAKAILAGDIRKGNRIKVSAEDFKIEINP